MKWNTYKIWERLIMLVVTILPFFIVLYIFHFSYRLLISYSVGAIGYHIIDHIVRWNYNKRFDFKKRRYVWFIKYLYHYIDENTKVEYGYHTDYDAPMFYPYWKKNFQLLKLVKTWYGYKWKVFATVSAEKYYLNTQEVIDDLITESKKIEWRENPFKTI